MYQVQDQEGLLFNLMRLVERTNTQLVFEVYSTHTFLNPIKWEYFGTPNTGPRQILTYRVF